MMRLCYHHIVTGGTTYGWFTVHRPTVPPDGVPGFHQLDARRVSAAGPAFRDRAPRPDGGLADGWETADCSPVYRVQKLPPANPRGSVIVYSDVYQDLRAASGPGSLVRHGPGESQPVDSRPLARVVGGAPRPW